MIKEIKYNGYSANPSDYACPDGDLAGVVNLIPEDGALKPIQQPAPIFSLPSSQYKIIYIHKTADYTHYLIELPNGELAWIDEDDVSGLAADPTLLTAITGVANVASITSMGNTLSVTTETPPDSKEHIYLLWKEGAYVNLGERPPFPVIEFGLVHDSGANVSETSSFEISHASYTASHNTGGNASSQIVSFRLASTDIDGINALTNHVMGLVNKGNSELVTKLGYFNQPFFVRYALRLNDGTHAWHSTPVLMLPNTCPPQVRVIQKSQSYNDNKYMAEVQSTYTPARSYLKYRFVNLQQTDIATLQNWSDVVAGIDVFISAPIYTYIQDAKVYNETSISGMLRGAYDNIFSPPPSRLRGAHRPGSGDTTTYPTNYFMGHYGGTTFIDQFYTYDVNDTSRVWNIESNEKFEEDLLSVKNFYKIAHIEIKNLSLEPAGLHTLELIQKDLTALVTFPTLDDDYMSHSSFYPSCQYEFNHRLNIADVIVTPNFPFPLRSMAAYSNPDITGQASPTDVNTNGVQVTLSVWLSKEGKVIKVDYTATGNESKWISLATNFPRYLFYPDETAFAMKLSCTINNSTTTIYLPLTQSDFLNGAYWYGGLVENPNPTAGLTGDALTQYQTFCQSLPQNAESSYRLANRIFTSNAGVPFYFPATNINAVGNGQILAIISSARALSQGQFGQFPLYAFTTEGVWALTTNTTGGYSSVQPITRDVLSNIKSVTQIDNAVLFVADRGIMLLAGSNTTCISDNINTSQPFVLSTLPNYQQLADILTGIGIATNRYDYAPFRTFIDGCAMIYDYTNQRVVVYNPNYAYAYVYSLKSKEWGMMQSNISYGVNSYPDAWAVIVTTANDNTTATLSDLSPNNIGVNSGNENAAASDGDDNAEVEEGENNNEAEPEEENNNEAEPEEENNVEAENNETVETGDDASEGEIVGIKGMLVTRPLKLDMPNTHKTVDTVIQRGMFDFLRAGRTPIRSIIYGSRDLFNWVPVWSSGNHCLRGFSGTPYKYFRIVLIVDLLPTESIYGCSVQYTPRLVNRLR